MKTNEELLKEFGQRVRMYRKNKGMTMEELALAVGYSNRSSIAMVEAGKRDISHEKVLAIAKVLGVDPYLLMFGEEEEKSEEKNTDYMMLTDKETQLIIEFRSLTEREQNMILGILKAKED